MAKSTKPIPNSHASKAKRELIAERRADMSSELKAMATKANARLAALERAGLTSASNAYRYVEKRHFDRDTMLYVNRSGKIRFTTSVKGRSAQQLQHEVRELQRFLYESKTSTVTGAKARYTRAFETYKKHWNSSHGVSGGGGLQRSQFDAIVNAEGFAAFVKAYGSSQIADLMEAAEDPAYDIEAALESFTPGMTQAEFWESAQVPQAFLGNDDDYDFDPFDIF